MRLFSNLRQQAASFLENYKAKNPATYAAAEQAIGAVLIADGFIGIDNPLGGRKRPGIFGTIISMVVAVIFMLIPAYVGNAFGTNSMTATTQATVVSVGAPSYRGSDSGGACSLTVSYAVDGRQYTKTSPIMGTNYCSLSEGQVVKISYNPANPGSWAYDAKLINILLGVFFWIGLLVLVSSIVTFFIRLLSIIFGWKLLKDGRRNAASLPPGTNLDTIVNEIRRNFITSVFGYGGGLPASIVDGVSSMAAGDSDANPGKTVK